MLLEQILPAMRAGHKATHLDWPETKYLTITDGKFFMNSDAISGTYTDKKSKVDILVSQWLSDGWTLLEPEADSKPGFKTLPVTVYGFSSPDVPKEARDRNVERANKAVELMDSASRAIVQEVCDLIARASGSDLAEALEKVMLDSDDASSLARTLEFWVRKHKAAGAELHGACCNRPTHLATQKVLDEQMD
jgi:hypothetical protein